MEDGGHFGWVECRTLLGVGLDPENEILNLLDAPNELLLVYGLLSFIGLFLTFAKSIEHLRLFGLAAWACGVVGGWSIGVGEIELGFVTLLTAKMFVILGSTWYDGSAKAW